MISKPVITKEVAPLPRRAVDAHKGQVGRILVIGGCYGERTMVGAPALTARAAFRAGAGLVQVVVPEPLLIAVPTLAPLATARPLPLTGTVEKLLRYVSEYEADVVAIGPGLGNSIEPEPYRAFLAEMASRSQRMVVDADGLNLLAALGEKRPRLNERCVLTPHPGELRRLIKGLGGSAPEDRMEAGLLLHDLTHATVVLKGHRTLVTNGALAYVNETGNAGMASAGMGDVLTGMIAALMGQGMEPFEASVTAAYLHGLAGDFAAGEMGQHFMTAEDVLEALALAFAELEA